MTPNGVQTGVKGHRKRCSSAYKIWFNSGNGLCYIFMFLFVSTWPVFDPVLMEYSQRLTRPRPRSLSKSKRVLSEIDPVPARYHLRDMGNGMKDHDAMGTCASFLNRLAL